MSALCPQYQDNIDRTARLDVFTFRREKLFHGFEQIAWIIVSEEGYYMGVVGL